MSLNTDYWCLHECFEKPEKISDSVGRYDLIRVLCFACSSMNTRIDRSAIFLIL